MPLWVSLRAALTATVIVTVLGVSLGYALARGSFPGRDLIEAAATLPVALPPTVVGYYLLTELAGVTVFGRTLVFTFTGIVIAQVVECFPYCLRASRQAIAAVDPRMEQAARTLGLSELRVLATVTLPLARAGIVAGVALAFGRALGDYGATVAVSGGSPGTTTMPIALYDASFDGSADTARTLALIQIVVALVILIGVSRLGRTRAW